MLFNSIEVYGNNSIVGITGNTDFNDLSLALEYFSKISDRLNDNFTTVYLLLK
jgi:hypothetical protein